MNEASYDPWDDINDALDADADPVVAHDDARAESLAWHIAVSGEGRAVYLREYEKLREKRDRAEYMREYMREYRLRKPAA